MKDEDEMRPTGIPPWHLWGNQLTIDMTSTGTAFDLVSSQLAKVSYGRPETWSFLFWVQVLSNNNPSVGGVLQARFNLVVGTGRTAITLPDFVIFLYSPLLPIGGQNPRYTMSATDTESNLVTDFPAEDIQLNVNSIITGGAPVGTHIVLNVGAAFAPKSHIRPEWYEGKFRGGEDEGK